VGEQRNAGAKIKDVGAEEALALFSRLRLR
jgi:hypothetical protein